jgi:broad specificity phosphatase PhoE
MGTIYVVRHAQAAFGTDDYDRLTQTGFEQARLLGAFFRLRQIHFNAVYTGTLRRHAETAQGILEPYLKAGEAPIRTHFPALNEYSPEALLLAFTGAAAPPDLAAAVRDSPMMRQHFRLLRQALIAWTEKRIQPAGMPVWRDFQDGAVAALIDARQRFPEGNVLLVSSGGPIAAITAAALNAPAATAIELNLRLRNSSLTEFASSGRRHALVTFNALPHLDTLPDAGLITYA